jgi:hypothetical protein
VVRLVAPRFLAATDLGAQLRELVAGAANGRTDRPVWHVHVDPPIGWDRPDVIRSFLHNLEVEFDLADQPRLGVLHSGKDGSTRLHAHIVYSLVRQDGRVVDLRNSYRRREKVSVVTAHQLGLPPPPVPRPRSLLRALIADGNEDAARWMVDRYPGLREPARVGTITPQRRHISERTSIDPSTVRDVLAAAWPPSSPRAFQRQLAEAGLALAQGEKTVVVVDASGTAHALNRELRAACKSTGVSPPSAAQVRGALTGLRLPPLDTLKRIKAMATVAENENKRAYEEQLAAGIIGKEIVADFGDQVKSAWPTRGSRPSRVCMRDGGWLTIDKPSRRIVVTGPAGQADALAARLAAMEEYEVERQESRRRRRLRSLFSAGPADNRPPAGPSIDRFEYWAAAGYTPSRLADGSIAVDAGGTRLIDTGNHVEIHDEPPSDEAIRAMVAVARDRWNGGLRLTGPWGDEARALVWLECQRSGVMLADYEPSPALVSRWRDEQGSGGAAATGLRPVDDRVATAAPMPAAGTSSASPDQDEPELEALQAGPHQEQLDEIERLLQQQHSLWRTHANDRDAIERARREIEQLEERRRRLLGQSRQHDASGEHESDYRGPR